MTSVCANNRWIIGYRISAEALIKLTLAEFRPGEHGVDYSFYPDIDIGPMCKFTVAKIQSTAATMTEFLGELFAREPVWLSGEFSIKGIAQDDRMINPGGIGTVSAKLISGVIIVYVVKSSGDQNISPEKLSAADWMIARLFAAGRLGDTRPSLEIFPQD